MVDFVLAGLTGGMLTLALILRRHLQRHRADHALEHLEAAGLIRGRRSTGSEQ
jgi:hypothetical protein